MISGTIHVISKNENVVIVTLGNDFRGDDGAGILFGSLIKEHTDLNVINGGNAPENVTGLIVKSCPDTIVIVDALDFGGRPGESICVSGDKLEGAGISTHGSLKLFVDYLKKMTDARIIILGFEPESLGLGEEISVEVRKGVKRMAERVIESGVGSLESLVRRVKP